MDRGEKGEVMGRWTCRKCGASLARAKIHSGGTRYLTDGTPVIWEVRRCLKCGRYLRLPDDPNGSASRWGRYPRGIVQAVVEAARNGTCVAAAARRYGIPGTTAYSWVYASKRREAKA